MRWQDTLDTLEQEGLYQHLLVCHYNGSTVERRGDFALSAAEIVELFDRLNTRRTQPIALSGKTFRISHNDGVVLVASRPGLQVVCGRKLVSCLVAVSVDADRDRCQLAEERLRAVLYAPASGKSVPPVAEKEPSPPPSRSVTGRAKAVVRALLPAAAFLLFS